MSTWVAHLSDPHLDGQVVVRERLTRVAAWLRALPTPPAIILVTGDLTEPDPGVDVRGELAWLDEALRFGPAVLYCPGNSDERAAYRAFLDARGDRFADVGGQLHRTATVDGLTFLLLDSTVPGSFAGRLEAGTMAWVRNRVDDVDGPIVIAAHHPPVALGHPVVDELRLHDAGELEQLVRTEPRVVAMMCGHTHAATISTFGGRPLLIAPGVHSAGQSPLAAGDPGTGLIDETSDPALALHCLTGERIISYVHTVGAL